MALKEKKSLYDRNYRLSAGAPVGQNSPQDGGFYTNEGTTNSPFETTDHMVDLLNNNVTTTTGNTYQPAPNQSQFQDIEGIDIASNTPPKYEDNLPS